MSKPVNEINKFIDYISNPTNIWDSKKYKQNDSELHISESGKLFPFRYTYILGTAYMSVELGIEGETLEVFYRENQGFQVVTSIGDRERSRASFPPHGTEQVKEHINRIINLS